MSLDEDYPKTFRENTARLRALLALDPAVKPEQRNELARAISDMADLACDLEDIVRRLVEEPHTPEEVGQLLIAIELTTEQLRGNSDIIDGKLYAIGDRLNGVTPEAEPS
jgi:hypothetical protein